MQILTLGAYLSFSLKIERILVVTCTTYIQTYKRMKPLQTKEFKLALNVGTSFLLAVKTHAQVAAEGPHVCGTFEIAA